MAIDNRLEFDQLQQRIHLAVSRVNMMAEPYAENKRSQLNVKHSRSTDVVAIGCRIHKAGSGMGRSCWVCSTMK
ncbi:MAG: hypothetical protein ACKVK3_13815 [Acidimicrobiales bacterium]